MSETVAIDSSALLALINNEPGGEAITSLLADEGRLIMLTVNLAEVVAKLVDANYRRDDISAVVSGIPVEWRPFSRDLAVAAGLLRAGTRHLGLSSGDRACLAFALSEGLPVLTADRLWAQLEIGLEVRLIR